MAVLSSWSRGPDAAEEPCTVGAQATKDLASLSFV